MKKVGRFSLSELQDDTSVIDKEYQKTLIGGRSYTPQEFGYLINSGQWHGGWVYGMGWVTPEVNIYPNSYNYSGGYYPSGTVVVVVIHFGLVVVGTMVVVIQMGIQVIIAIIIILIIIRIIIIIGGIMAIPIIIVIRVPMVIIFQVAEEVEVM